jgi:hypothetical protein
VRRDLLQRRYRPSRVRLLFIGEAPPASGRFFYRRDSGLYRAIRDGLQRAHPDVDEANFLDAFRSAGCYLIDLCPRPVDRLDAKPRRAACRASEARLAGSIRRLQPEGIAIVVRSIRGNVERAADSAGWQGPVFDLPYPGRWVRHRRVFVEELAGVFRGLDKLGTQSHNSIIRLND